MGSSDLIGQTLAGTYKIESVIGRGGMGAVYKAQHLRLAKKVAIKVLHGGAACDPEIFARFRREADVTSRLEHPNIVHISDFNQLPDGAPYLVMDFLTGEDLNQRLRRDGPLDFTAVLPLAQQIAAGLYAAHRLGVVHRDLKPGNIFLAQIGVGEDAIEVPKIVDFGISKLLDTRADSIQTHDRVIGTPSYMSPEQASGRNDQVDARTDQWALAAILYQCLSGRLPFDADGIPAILLRVVTQEPTRLSALAPLVPDHAVEAITRALRKDRDARFPDVREFVRALSGSSVSGMRTPPLGVLSDALRPPVESALIEGAPVANSAQLSPTHASSAPPPAVFPPPALPPAGPPPPALPLAASPAPSPTPRAPVEAPTALPGTLTLSSRQVPPPPPDGRARLALPAALALFVAALVVLVGARSRPASDLTPRQVEVLVAVTPPEAQLVLDGEPLLSGRAARVPARAGGVVVASAPGYRPRTESVSLMRDVNLMIILEPIEAPPVAAVPPPTEAPRAAPGETDAAGQVGGARAGTSGDKAGTSASKAGTSAGKAGTSGGKAGTRARPRRPDPADVLSDLGRVK